MDASGAYASCQNYLQELNEKKIKEIWSKSCLPNNLETMRVLPDNARKFKSKKNKNVIRKNDWKTEELKQNIEVIELRNALDPKRFYKRGSSNVQSKNIEVGKVVDSPLDFYSSRIPKKQRKSNLVDELLADAEFRKYNKKCYAEIIKDETRRKTRFKKIAKKKIKKNKNLKS